MSQIATLSDVKEVEPLTFRLTSNWEEASKSEKMLCKEKVDEPGLLFVALSHQMPVKSYKKLLNYHHHQAGI